MAKTKAPASLRVIGWLALLWNLVGTVMFFRNINLGPEQLAALPPGQQEVYLAMPAWLTVDFGIAVFSGVLGSLALLRYSRWAVVLFGISLVAVVTQMIGVYATTPSWRVSGAAGLPLTVVLIVIAGFLFWYAVRARSRGWIG